MLYFKAEMHQIRFVSAEAPPQTPLGELATLPQTTSRLGRGKPPPHSPTHRRLRRRKQSISGSAFPVIRPLCVTTLGKLFTPMCLCHQAV